MSDYRGELLPKNEYLQAIVTEELAENSYLIRKREVTIEDQSTYPRVEEIFPLQNKGTEKESLAYKHLFTLSINLLGIFTPADLNLNPHPGTQTEDWLKNEPLIELDKVEYEIGDNHGLYSKITSLHGKKLPYSKDLPEKVWDVEKQKKVKKMVTSDYEGTIKIYHRPSRTNYWHFQIKILDADKNEIIKTKSNWCKEAAIGFSNSVLRRILSRAVPSEYDTIEEKVFVE